MRIQVRERIQQHIYSKSDRPSCPRRMKYNKEKETEHKYKQEQHEVVLLLAIDPLHIRRNAVMKMVSSGDKRNDMSMDRPMKPINTKL